MLTLVLVAAKASSGEPLTTCFDGPQMTEGKLFYDLLIFFLNTVMFRTVKMYSNFC